MKIERFVYAVKYSALIIYGFERKRGICLL